MPRAVDGSPSPKSHIKTLMRIGYDFCTAVADIVDNSISANSSNVKVFCPPGQSYPYIRISDDGKGMRENELLNNMRIGCKDPSADRDVTDLGRFGSGLKTASFSQARSLTVISKTRNGDICGARWDIDNIEKTDSWCLEILDKLDISKLIEDGKVDIGGNGTQVIWDSLTCYQKDSHSLNTDEEMAKLLMSLKSHLGLYFHRFIGGGNKCNFYINNALVLPIDPFLTRSDGYQEGPSERFRCKGGHIEIKTHVLPSLSSMTQAHIDLLGGAMNIAQQQGLYIYRNKRLINAGGWLNLAKNHQLSALARVQIDIPAALDEEWSTDVKKASLQLPPRIKRDLKKYLKNPIKKSQKTYTYKGQIDEAGTLWNIVVNEEEKIITYEINYDNTDLKALMEKLSRGHCSTLIAYLTKISKELPLDHIYNTMADRPKYIQQGNICEFDLNMIFDKPIRLGD
mgnify:FL=1|jgi:hypothetical protein|tara:strand:+ start:328 stop:1692 length:1365 start_codon:yes stop_codon:yes gene_type:complete